MLTQPYHASAGALAGRLAPRPVGVRQRMQCDLDLSPRHLLHIERTPCNVPLDHFQDGPICDLELRHEAVGFFACVLQIHCILCKEVQLGRDARLVSSAIHLEWGRLSGCLLDSCQGQILLGAWRRHRSCSFQSQLAGGDLRVALV